MTLTELLTATMATALASWLLVSPDAHVTDRLRAWMTSGVVKRANAAEMELWESSDPGRRLLLRRGWWTQWTVRLGCRVCMGLEWSVASWLLLTLPWQRWVAWYTPAVWLVELAAINGTHLTVVKLTATTETHGDTD